MKAEEYQEYLVLLKSSEYSAQGSSPSVQEMQEWLQSRLSQPRKRYGRHSVEMPAPPQEFEERLQRVWGTNTTPAMQTLDCIQKVKAALSEQEEDDSISPRTFGLLVAGTLLVVAAVVVVWELFLRPR